MTEAISPLDTLRTMVAMSAEDEGIPTPQAFTAQAVALLEEAGELNGPERFEAPVGRIDAFDWDADTGRLTTIITDFAPTRWGEVRDRRELLPFVNETVAQLSRLLLPAQQRDASTRIISYLGDIRGDIRAIRLVAVSNGSFESQQGVLEDIAGVPSEFAIWDAGDLATAILHTAARTQTIDFSDEPGGGIRTLGPIGTHETSSYLMVVPGDLIADLYQAHGASILGRNIRAFLQVSNRVNKGIRQSLRETPESFFAFNNGLSLTATGLKRALVAGQPVVTAITGLEIVNGGQTTASLHHAKYHDGVNLAGVWVQAKLTVLPATDSDDTALKIARFANSQSPVRMGDLTSNNRFFQSIEQLSRTVDFSTDRSGRLWFFERTRGQFATETAAARALGAEARFKRKHDRTRRFDKSELAKFELAWLQMPQVVAAGAEKSLATFMNLEHGPASGGVPDEKYYRRLVAKAVLWAETDRVIGALDLGGYKAVDVGYTIALISNRTAGRLDLDAVARRQDAGDAWRHAVASLAPLVHQNLIESAGARNVSSWSKTAAAWIAVQEIDWSPESGLTSYSPAADETRMAVAASQAAIGLAADDEDIAARGRVEEYGSQAWFQLSSWAKETDNLQGWQRGIAFSVGRLLAADKTPSAKQVTQANKILDEASRLGFVPKRG